MANISNNQRNVKRNCVTLLPIKALLIESIKNPLKASGKKCLPPLFLHSKESTNRRADGGVVFLFTESHCVLFFSIFAFGLVALSVMAEYDESSVTDRYRTF
jgi:hypothetical protein